MREEQEDKEAAEKLKIFKDKKTSNHKEGDLSCRLAKGTGTEKLKILRERMKRESTLVIEKMKNRTTGLDRVGGNVGVMRGLVEDQNDEAICSQGGATPKRKTNFEGECSTSSSPAKRAKNQEFSEIKSFWAKIAASQQAPDK